MDIDEREWAKGQASIMQAVTCPVCQELAWNPYVLPVCGHTFCYTCIKSWCQCNPSCPLCRQGLSSMAPVSNHSVKKIVQTIVKLLPGGEGSVNERQKDYVKDEGNGFPWLKKLETKFGRALVDNDDGVPRCSACHWELVDGQCENCGRTMVGWEDRTDGDNLNSEEEEDDGWENERNGRGGDLVSEDEDRDYDNGLSSRRRFAGIEAEEDDEEEDNYDEGDDEVDWGDDDELPLSMRRRPTVVYESRNSDGDIVLLNTDGERPVPGEPVRITRLKDDSNWDDHDRRLSSKPWLDQYESDDGFVVDDDDEQDENSGSSDDDEEEQGYNDTGLLSGDNLASGDEDLFESNRVLSEESDEEDDDEDRIGQRKTRANHKKAIAMVISLDDDDDDEEDEDNNNLLNSLRKKSKTPVQNLSDDSDDDHIVITSKRQRNLIDDNSADERNGSSDNASILIDDDEGSESEGIVNRSRKHKQKRRH